MNTASDSASTAQPGDPTRRRFIGGVLLGVAAWNLGGAWASSARASGAVEVSTAPPAFFEVSQALCGKGHLEAGLALRLYKALLADHADFAAQLDQLAALLHQRGGSVDGLQDALDQSKASCAALPRRIATAWFVGVVGEGESARCIAYEESLMNLAVADQLKPPSYAFGSYGSWSQQPGPV